MIAKHQEIDSIDSLKRMYSNVLKATGFTLITPYIVPTMLRLRKEYINENLIKEKIVEEDSGLEAGFNLGLIMHILVCTYLGINGFFKEALLISTVSNIASGTYELVRHVREEKLKKQGTTMLEDMMSSD